MSDSGTTRMIEAYRERAQSPLFLSRLFRTPEENFHRSEKVEIDVVRSDPHIAVPVKSVGAGARAVENSKYTNKAYEPTIVDLETSISAYAALKRRAGMDPFQDPDFLRAAGMEAFEMLGVLEGMIRRTVELMCSQVLQTGAISLVDSAGAVQYSCDFLAKATHKVTVGTSWATDGSTGSPLADIGALAEVVRQDGKAEPDQLTFGRSALQRFLANADVKARFDNRRLELAQFRPEDRGAGATFFGWVWIDQYRFEVWGYKDTFLHPQTGVHTPYVGTDNVIMTASTGRRDLTFGELPILVPPDARAAQFLPPSMVMPEIGLQLTTNAWITPNGKHLMLAAGTRPLPIPTAIDTIGVLDVTA